MKTLFPGLLAGLTLALTGCDYSYHEFHDKFTAEPVLTYRISTTGTFTEVAVLSIDELKRELQVNKPNAKVTKFNLESMVIDIEENPDNVADEIRILEFLAREPPYTTNLIDRKNINVSKSGALVANGLLIAGGVEDVSKFLAEQLAKSINPLNVRTDMRVGMKGTTLPSGAKASLTLRVKLKYDIEYTYCEYLPEVVFGKGFDECD